MKYLSFILIYLFILFYQLPAPAAGTSGNPEQVQLFVKANEAYRQKNYQEACDKYQALANSGLVNGHLYYNLGNCYTKLNNTGKAMVYYLKAKESIPRDADLESNINFLKKRISDNQENSEDSQIFNRIFFWYDQLSLPETLFIFLVLWSILFTFLILRRFVYSELIRMGVISLILLNLIFGISLLFKLSEARQPKAVVISQEANVKSSTDLNSVTIFKVHEGTVLKVTEKTDKWRKIELTKDKRGWIQDTSIESL
jgi:tetratricopeptide (TPR) repeat protein